MNIDSKKEQNEQYTIPVVRRSFFDEFKYPLDKVQRKGLRRSVTLFLSPILIFFGAVFGAYDLGKQWFDECW